MNVFLMSKNSDGNYRCSYGLPYNYLYSFYEAKLIKLGQKVLSFKDHYVDGKVLVEYNNVDNKKKAKCNWQDATNVSEDIQT